MRSALLIGVAHYDEYSRAIANSVLGDLTAMTTQLKGLGWSIAKVLGEGGAAVKAHDIEAAVVTILRQAKDDDDILIYFSGHGRRRNGVDHLVPTDARVEPPLGSPFDDLVALSRFDAVRDGSPARSVTYVIDACRDGPGADDDATAPPRTPDANKAVSMLFASSAGETAGTDGDMSVFTRALLTAITRVGDDARLPTVTAAVQAEVTRLAGDGRAQRIDFGGNVAGRSIPFPLFGTGIPPTATTTWTDSVETGNRGLWPDDRLAGVLDVVDRIESGAPDLVLVPGPDMWADPLLPRRLAWALGYVAQRAKLSPDEALLLLGTVAVVEAGFRRTELALLRQNSTPRIDAIIGSAPQLRDALRADAGRRDGPVRAWIAHLASPSHCVVHDRDRLRADLADVLRAIVPPEADEMSAELTRRVDYVLDCVATGFDESSLRTELDESSWLDNAWTCRLRGRRLAAAIELTWSLALDTRLCSPGFGPQLLAEPEETVAVLGALGGVRWREDRNVLSLALHCASPVLDHELRQRVEHLTAQLLRDTQPDGALHGTGIPVAATASALEPVKGSYRVPHVTFALSTAEMYSLLMGARFYGDRMLAVRELYQNAVDACLYRELREQRSGVEPEPPEIEFRLHEVDGVRVLDCLDNGVGMSHHELSNAFAKIGGRFRDLPEYLEEQATWSAEARATFHPISQFGIGVLAYFMIADRVELWTVRRYADRSRFHPGLQVEIPGGADLFRVKQDPPDRWMPRATGTRVRFHLEADVNSEDVREVLARTIRAPRVKVRYRDEYDSRHDREWSPGLLYTADGTLRERCLARPDLGVYLHEGRGEVLINGVPIDAAPAFQAAASWRSSETDFLRAAIRRNWAEGPVGCTLSLDGRARPDLTADRGTLRSFDVATVRESIRAAVDERIVGWPATANWLYALFRTDPQAGRRAYALLKDQDLPLVTEKRAAVVRPSRDGIWLGDLIDGRGPDLRNGAASTSWFLGARRTVLLSTETATPRLPSTDDQPAFDDRLATTCALVGGGTPWFGDVIATLDQVVEVAEALEMTLGATTVYLWSLILLDAPGRPLHLSASRGRQSAHSVRSNGYGSRLVVGLDVRAAVDIPRFGEGPEGEAVLRSFGLTRADIAELSPAARALWSRDADGVNPYLTQWRAVAAGVPKIAGLAAADRAEPRFSSDEIAIGLRQLAPLFGLDDTAATGVAVPSFAPPPPPDPDWTTSDVPPVDTSDPAIHDALAKSPGEENTKYYTGRVPALAVAEAALAHGRDPAVLAAALAQIGIEVAVATSDWAVLTELLTEVPLLSALVSEFDGLYLDGTLDVIPSLDDLAEMLRLVGEAPLRKVAARLVRAGVAGPRTRAFQAARLPWGAATIRQADLLKSVTSADWRTLASTAVAAATTYAEAFAVLGRFRPLFDAWTLPDDLPPDLAALRPGALTRQFLQVFGAETGGSERAAVSAVHVSVTRAVPIGAVLDEVAPLLRTAGIDVGAMTALGDLSTEPLIFDDLLLLGTQQLDPPVTNLKEAVQMCAPTARQPARLAGRAKAWLRMRPPLLVGRRHGDAPLATLGAGRPRHPNHPPPGAAG